MPAKTAQHHHQHPSLISLDKTTKITQTHKIITANYCHKWLFLLTPNCTWASWPHFPTTSSRIIPHTPETKIPNKNSHQFFLPNPPLTLLTPFKLCVQSIPPTSEIIDLSISVSLLYTSLQSHTLGTHHTELNPRTPHTLQPNFTKKTTTLQNSTSQNDVMSNTSRKILPSTCLLSNSTYPTKPAHQPTPVLKPLQQLQTSTLPLLNNTFKDS